MTTATQSNNRNRDRKSYTPAKPHNKEGKDRHKPQPDMTPKKSAYWQHCFDWAFVT